MEGESQSRKGNNYLQLLSYRGKKGVGGEKVQKGFLKELITGILLASSPSLFFNTTPSQSLWFFFHAYSQCFFLLPISTESNVCVCVCVAEHVKVGEAKKTEEKNTGELTTHLSPAGCDKTHDFSF